MSLIEADLALLRTASLFDLATPQGRKLSVESLRRLFFALHEVLQPQVVLEIGAKEATFSRTMRKALPNAKVIAFEANPFVYAKQRKLADPIAEGVDYRHLAVSDRTGEISFFVQTRRGTKPVKRTVGSNSLMARLGDVETEEVTVASTRIDELIAAEKLEGSKTAWIDVEGAIGLVLAGLGPVLDQFTMVFAEVEEREFWADQWTWPKVQAFFAERGFHAVARDFEYEGQNNVLFVRADVLHQVAVRRALTVHYSSLAHPAAAS
jgi:FkbM family methyltransferase